MWRDTSHLVLAAETVSIGMIEQYERTLDADGAIEPCRGGVTYPLMGVRAWGAVRAILLRGP